MRSENDLDNIDVYGGRRMTVISEIAERTKVVFTFTLFTIFSLIRDIVMWFVYVADEIAYGETNHLCDDTFNFINSIYDSIGLFSEDNDE